MIRVIEHGAVRELEMSTRLSRSLGYKVSSFWHRGILIDTGFPRMRRELGQALDRLSVTGAIVTHFHEDHSGNVGLMVERRIPVAMTEETTRLVDGLTKVRLYRSLTWGSPKPPGSVMPLTDYPFTLVPTPGHSSDHVAVWDPVDRIAFTGDLFLGVRAAAVHREEDPRQTLESTRRILALEPAMVFDAHRSQLRNPMALLTAKIDWLGSTIDTVERRLGEGAPPSVIVKEVLGGEDRIAIASRGEVSKKNFVLAIARQT